MSNFRQEYDIISSYGNIETVGEPIMILVLDVGNSNISVGVYNDDRLQQHWQIANDRPRTADEFAVLLKSFFDIERFTFQQVTGIIISSVVPTSMYALEQMCKKYFHIPPLVVGPGVKTGLNIKYENPREVGADRIVNAVSALHKYGGRPLIIVDFGTAITYCAINEKGEYLGGAIAPGLTISMDALYTRAAKLPRVELVKPSSIIAKNTVSAMQAGIFYGFVGQVEGIVSRMKHNMKDDPLVIATGGLVTLMVAETQAIDLVDEFLTLNGLHIIYKRNQTN